MNPIRMDAVVGTDGKVEVTVPLPEGTAVEVLVLDSVATGEDGEPLVEWNEHLQGRLDALDRGEVDPRPWREVVEEIRQRLTRRETSP